MKNIIFLILLFLFYSCDSDPVKTPFSNGSKFEQYIFKLDNKLTSYQDSLNLINTSYSDLLVSGLIRDLKLDNSVDTVKAFLSIDLNKFFDYKYEICSSVVSIEIPTISIFATIDLSDIVNSDNLKIKLLPSHDSYIQENSEHWREDGKYLLDPFEICDEASADGDCELLEYDISENSNNELVIILPNSVISEDLKSISCQNSYINLMIEYQPDENDEIQYIEWYSSDFSTEYSLTPKFNLDYIKMELIDTTEYQFTLEEISSVHGGYYFINNSLSNDWSSMYFANIQDSLSGVIDSLIDFNIVSTEDPIISDGDLLKKIDLGTLKIKLNDNSIAQDSIDNLIFSLQNVKVYINSTDPSGDNYDGNDTLLTDGNGLYDLLYNSSGDVIGREKFNDYGLDNCKNEHEDGLQGCCDEDNESCMPLYNNMGTQNNGILNWYDIDGDNLWSLEDDGEKWLDVGSDGCSDEYEDGVGGCTTIELSPYNVESNIDPNGDNYNIDPNGDDYSISSNPDGTEDNGILNWTDDNEDGLWDDGEGEQWLDYGLDGIPNTGDIGESDGIHDMNFEYFFDYGLDNIDSENEEGFCDTCSENNREFDSGELNPEDDVGQDGCEDKYEDGIGGCTTIDLSPYNIESNTDPNGDNYNIDPNGDNYNISQNSGTENNNILDWNDSIENQEWDDGEGERWFDYGIDQTQDAYEQYLPANQVSAALGVNSYEINIDNFIEYQNDDIPELGSSQVAIWVSSIIKNQDSYDVTISMFSNRKIDAVKVNLSHPIAGSNLKVTWPESYSRHYIQNVSWHDYEDEAGNIIYEKMFEDYSLYDLKSLSLYSNILEDSLALINYGYDISCNIKSEEFENFLKDYSSGAISRLHSKIVIPVDTVLTNLSDASFKIDLGLISNLPEDSYSSSSIYGSDLNLAYGFSLVDESNINLEIKIGDLIQYHISKDIPFEGFTLRSNSQFNNFNNLYLKNFDGYIYMVVEK